MYKALFVISAAVLLFGAPSASAQTRTGKAEPAAPKAAPAVSEVKQGEAWGRWTLLVDAGGETHDVALNVTKEAAGVGGSLTSAAGSGTVKKGSVNGQSLALTVSAVIQGQQMDLELEGKIDGDKMTGTIFVPGLGPATFSGSRVK